jgi:serine/threonine-protein kinase
MKRSTEIEVLASRGRPLAVGKYRVLAELGRGGMANVYLAVIRGPGGVGKLVVLKALLAELASEPEAVAMFLDEARLATQLNHANVVQTYEVGTEGERHVIVMEYLEGQSLSAVLQRADAQGQPLPRELHLRILLSVLDGLHYAHEVKGYDGAALALVHRDVSPQNVFVCYDGQVKVLDFGIAKAATSAVHTATGLLKGKMAYMPPEQMSGSNIDRRADVFAVGCMLWGMAAGRKLWKDVPNVRIFRKVMNGEIPSPRTVNSLCDEELERITMKALAPDPEARYATALALHEDLERYAERFERAKSKSLGAFVAGLFPDTRRELKQLIDRQLAALSAQGDDAHSSMSTRTEGQRTHLAASVDVPSLGPSTGTGSRSQTQPPAKHGKTLVVAAGALLAAASFLLFRQTHGKIDAEAGSAHHAATEGVSTPQSSAPTAIVLEAQPAEATLTLDGEQLMGNPVTKLLPRDERVHRLAVVANGHIAVTREFVVEAPATISVVLVKTEAPLRVANADGDNARKGKRVVGSLRPASVPATTPKAPNCTEAFFIDATGTRRVRPECL